MAETVDYAIGGSTQPSQLRYAKLVVLKRVMKATDIIASNAVLTAAAKIAAGDIIQAINIPAGFVALKTVVDVTAVGTAASTVDIGTGGGDQWQDGLDIATATVKMTLVGDDYGGDNVEGVSYAATDTLDVTYVADEITGSFTVYLVGFMLN